MKALPLITLSLFILFISCDKNQDSYAEDCKGYSAAIYKHGYAFAEGSYQNFGDHAILIRERVADTINGGWMHDLVEKSISLNTLSEYCAETMNISLTNIIINTTDTILVSYSYLGLSEDFPTSSLNYMDADAGIEGYHLIPSAKNWLIIDQVNTDTTEIEGRFNLSFVTSYEPYLTGERERWDDPNRPDTLHFTNGEFRAVFLDF